MKRLILFILLIPALCFGDMNPYIAGQVIASNGSDVLVGDENVYSASITSFDPGGVQGKLIGYTASASGDIATGHLYINDNWGVGSGEGVKMLVYDSSRDLIATSAELDGASIVDDSWNTFTFSSGAITSGLTYYVTFIAEDTLKVPVSSDSGNNRIYDASGSYASPPDPMGTDNTIGGFPGGIYLKK